MRVRTVARAVMSGGMRRERRMLAHPAHVAMAIMGVVWQGDPAALLGPSPSCGWQQAPQVPSASAQRCRVGRGLCQNAITQLVKRHVGQLAHWEEVACARTHTQQQHSR